MKPLQGLNKDASKRSQPEGTYRDAKNAVVNEELGALRREKGLLERLDMGNFRILSHILLDEGDFILFLKDSVSEATPISKIARWDGQALTTIVVDTLAGDFSSRLNIQEPLESTYRSLANGDDVIYWTDGLNPPRFLNIDEGLTETNPSPDTLDIFPKIKTNLTFNLEEIIEFGGALKGGSYYLAFAYVDQDQSMTNYMLTRGPIDIPGEKGFGASSDERTRKGLRFQLNNLDQQYDQIRIALIKGTDVSLIPDIPINGSSLTYTISGTEDSIDGSLDEILIDRASYDTAKTMAQQDGTLYMGNLTSQERKDLQQYVNGVEVEVVSEKAPSHNGPQDQAMVDPEIAFEKGTFKRGEVYALYMSFLLDDGSETEAFHIPGRKPQEGVEAAVDIRGVADPPNTPSEETFNVANSIPAQGEIAEGEPVSIASGASASDTFNITYYDDAGQQIKSPTVSISGGDTAEQIATAIVNTLNADSLFSGSWTASKRDLGTGAWAIKMTADQTGSTWNGYYAHVENDAGNFTYSNGGPDPSGGKDDTSSAPNRDIAIEWDNGNQSVTTTCTTLNGNDSVSTAANKYATALQNDAGVTADWTITNPDSGDNTFTVTSNQNGEFWNGSITIYDGGGSEVRSETIAGGWDRSTDTLTVEIQWHSSYPNVVVDGIPSGDTPSNVAQAIVDASNAAGISSAEFRTNGGAAIATYTGTSIQREGDPIADFDTVPSNGWTWWLYGWEERGETTVLDTNHPLKDFETDLGTLRKYHHSAEPLGANNTGYWENQNETYPDDPRWDIYDDTGDTGETLRGDPIRHHRIPENDYEPFWDENQEQMHILGLRLKGVDIPAPDTLDIVGYRLYYAKKNPRHRLVLDQSTEIHGWLDDAPNNRRYQQRNEVFQDVKWSAWGWPYKTIQDGSTVDWDVDETLLQLHPFESLRKEILLSGTTHVKLSADLGYRTNLNCDDPWDQMTEGQEIRAVKGIAYIDQNQREINLSNFGFTHDYDNLFGESKVICELENPLPSKRNYLIDICQLRNDVHVPFENQELISTGYTGDISQSTSDVIFGGDVTISPWYYKANNLLALANPELGTESGGTINEWWNEDTNDNKENLHADNRTLEELKNILFGSNFEEGEVKGVGQALLELIGDISGIKNRPLAWGQLWYDFVESRDHPWRRTVGQKKTETFYPASDDWVENPDLAEIPLTLRNNSNDKRDEAYREAKWVFQFFVDNDNWMEYNDEYSNLDDLKPSFPFRDNEITKTNFPTRIIRSAENSETGLRSSWRQFLSEDYVDLPRNRGELMKIVPQNNNIIAHTEESLFRTRGRQEIEVGDQRAFLGVGDIFSVPPQQLLNLEEGFGGLSDPQEGIVTPFGYVFVDREAGKVYRVGDSPMELSNQGLRTWFRDNIDEDTPVRLGVDPTQNRLFLTEKVEDHTLSYMPGLKAWTSFHDFAPGKYMGNRSALFCEIDGVVYEVGAGEYGNYGGTYEDFSVQVCLPAQQLDAQIPITLWIDALVFDGNDNPVEADIFDSVQITNSYQDTGVVPLRPRMDPNGIQNRNFNIRKTDRVWKINDLRDTSNVPGAVQGTQDEWQYNRRLSDTYQEIKLVYGSVRNRVVALYNIFLNQRSSVR